MRPAARLTHAVLAATPEPLLFAAAPLTGRQRLGVLLQAAGLLSLLERAGWHLAAGWSDFGVTSNGRLAARWPLAVAPGRASRPAQELLRDLLGALFGGSGGSGGGGGIGGIGGIGIGGPGAASGSSNTGASGASGASGGPGAAVGTAGGRPGRLAGRGEALRAARELLAAWRQNLVPLAADAAVTQILDAAPFLWGAGFATARRSLAGALAWDEPGKGERLWVAGCGPFRRRLLAGRPSLAALADLLAGDGAEALWTMEEEGDALALAAARRWRAAVAAWRRHPPRGETERLELATALFALGRFEAALQALGRGGEAASRALRLRCQLQLGRLGAARATLRALSAMPLAAALLVEVADAAVRLLANVGEPAAAAAWAARALEAAERDGQAATAVQAELVAAAAAWDRQDGAAMDHHLARAERGLAQAPAVRWRWQQALGLRAMAAGRGEVVAEKLALALGAGRRLLARHEAAGLWNDLGVGRAQAGDLPGAERAFLHALRLFAGCDGPRATTLALHNLAEVRLRRGRLAGVHEILERSAAANRLAGNLRGLAQDAELLARYELLLGRPAAALALCRGAGDELARHAIPWRCAELSLLAARALGWLGRSAEAAAELATIPAPPAPPLPATPPPNAELDPEEMPALWAHAGALAAAQAHAAALAPPLADLWQRALSPHPPLPSDPVWTALAALPAHRAARLAYDLELLRPGLVPDSWRRAAADTFRHLGGEPPAALLEVDAAGAWRALAGYAAAPAGDLAALGDLFAAAGYPEADLTWWPAGASAAAEPASAPRLEARLQGGTLRLTARRVDEVAAALFALAARDVAAVIGTAGAAGKEGAPATAAAGWDAPPAVREPAAAWRASLSRSRAADGGMIGQSPRFRAAMSRLLRLARADIPVLILGESGTGKELAARRIHHGSARAAAPFLAVNCAALSETLLLADLFGHVRGAFTGADRDRAGVFESAHGGTVFLDEIGDLPPSAQGMLLRVLQEGEVRRLGESLPRRVDVRVLSATHRDLIRRVEAGAFRQDLFYRLRVGSVELPPLRDRGADVELLADHFLLRLASSCGRPVALSNEARALLSAHDWPGNVRELENRLRLAAALADGLLCPEHLDLPLAAPDAEPAPQPYHQEVDSLRRRLLAEALAACGGNAAEAGRRLGLSRQALSYLVRRLGLAGFDH